MATRTMVGLVLALVSAVAVNWAYTREHDAVEQLPPFSPRHPFRFIRLLLRDRQWRIGFGTESAGWLVYVAALRLAPLSLVQAIGASGIAVLALETAHGHPSRLPRLERLAVVVAFAGLVLLSLSLVDTTQSDHAPDPANVVLWLACVLAGGLLLARSGFGRAGAPALGLGAGVLFAGGDISAKLVVYGGAWILAAFALVVCYGLGTTILQGGFQHGSALTSAGLATLATNALPIAAGFVVFDEELPQNGKGALQVAAFALLVLSAGLLARAVRAKR